MMLVQDFGDNGSGNMVNEKWWDIELPLEIHTHTSKARAAMSTRPSSAAS